MREIFEIDTGFGIETTLNLLKGHLSEIPKDIAREALDDIIALRRLAHKGRDAALSIPPDKVSLQYVPVLSGILERRNSDKSMADGRYRDAHAATTYTTLRLRGLAGLQSRTITDFLAKTRDNLTEQVSPKFQKR